MIYYLGKFILYYITFLFHKIQLCINYIYPKVIIHRLRDKNYQMLPCGGIWAYYIAKKKIYFILNCIKMI